MHHGAVDGNCIDEEGAGYLAKYASGELVELDLGIVAMPETRIGLNNLGNQGAKVIMQSVAALPWAKSLRWIDICIPTRDGPIANNVIGVEGAREVARALEKSVALQDLNLEINCISDEGAKYIALSLAKNRSLHSLNLCIFFLRRSS